MPDNRQMILKLVLDSPGIHLRGVQKALGVSFSTVRYHVWGLAGRGELDCERRGRYLRLFPHGMSEGEREVFSRLQRSAAQKVLVQMIKREHWRNKDIASASGLAESTVSRERKAFRELGLLVVLPSPQGRGENRLVDSELLSRIIKLSRSRMRRAVDNYIELWDI